MFGLILLLGVAGIAGYIGYCYITAPAIMTTNAFKPEDPPITRPSTVMDKLAYSTKRSASLFVHLATVSGVMLVNGMLSMADWFGSPEMRQVVTQYFPPEVASVMILGLVGIGVWARVRNAMGA